MNFTITTTKLVALAIEQQLKLDERQGDRSYQQTNIVHHEKYSDVIISPKIDRIQPSDLFWLGYFTSKLLQ